MWIAALLVCAVPLSAIIGDLWTPTLRPGKPFIDSSSAGAALGAFAPLLLLNCLLLLPFAIDPVYLLVQEVLLAGIAGVVVDLPILLFQCSLARVPVRRAVAEAVALVALAGVLVGALVVFRLNYEPAQLPI